MARKIQKKKWSWKKKLQWIVLPSVGMTFIYGFNQYSQKNQTEISRQRIRIATVNAGVFQEYVPVCGSVLPLDTLYLDSPEGEQVLGILLEVGATVQKGEPLLRLKNKELELLVCDQEETINSEINQLEEMQLNQQQSRLEQQQLAKMEFDIEGLRRSYERQAAIVERRKQDSVIIRSQLATLALKAPVSGQFTPTQLKVSVAMNTRVPFLSEQPIPFFLLNI